MSHLMEATPQAGSALTRYGAVPALCAKLLAIEYIDVAEVALNVRFRHNHPPFPFLTQSYLGTGEYVRTCQFCELHFTRGWTHGGIELFGLFRCKCSAKSSQYCCKLSEINTKGTVVFRNRGNTKIFSNCIVFHRMQLMPFVRLHLFLSIYCSTMTTKVHNTLLVCW